MLLFMLTYVSEKDKLPTNEEMVMFNKVIEILKAFKSITTYMSSEKQPTSTLLMPSIHSLKRATEVRDTDTEMERIVKQAICEDTNTRYTEPEISEFLYKASALDPRCKSLAFLPPSERDPVFDSLKTEALSLSLTVQVKQEPDAGPSEGAGQPQYPTLVDEDVGPSPIKRTEEDEVDDWLSEVMITGEEKAIYRPADQVTNEFMRYHSEPIIGQKENPLLWWKSRSDTYPYISRLAKRYLCVVATSVPSERIFSDAGNIINAKRSCLDTDTVDMLIFLHKNA